MEEKMREKIGFRSITGKINNIKSVFKKTKFPLKFPEAILKSYTSATSREHKVQALESELKKAQALAEAHRRLMRIL